MRLKSVLMAAVLGTVFLASSPGQTMAMAKDIPVVFCSTSLSNSIGKAVDCAMINPIEKLKVDVRQPGLSVQRVLPRVSSSSVCTVFGKITDSLRELIERVGKAINLDPRLLEAVAYAESGGDQTAVSPAGAIGIMQLMPGTARSLGVNPYDPEQNVMGGGLYLKRQLDRYEGDLSLALAAYNAGPGAVEKYKGVPPYKETQQYIARVLSKVRRSY